MTNVTVLRRGREALHGLGALLAMLAGAHSLAAQECVEVSLRAPKVGSEVELRPGEILAERTAALDVRYVNPFGVRRRRWEHAVTQYRFVGRTGEFTYGFEEITTSEGNHAEGPPTVLHLSYWIADETVRFRVGFMTLRLKARGGTPIVRVVAVEESDRRCGERPGEDHTSAPRQDDGDGG